VPPGLHESAKSYPTNLSRSPTRYSVLTLGFGGGGTATDPLILREASGAFWVMDEAYKERYLRDLQISDNPFAEPVLLYSNWSNGAVGPNSTIIVMWIH
ncbi:MAG: hypothetical protein RIS50_919, partial [Bacteroidota bacterium]